MVLKLDDFEKAINSLDQALSLPKDDIVRDATIQRFEFTVELAWKSAKKKMGSSSTAPRVVIREMASQGIISDVNIWFEFLEARNLASHVYNEAIANKVYDTALQFTGEAKKLLAAIKNL